MTFIINIGQANYNNGFINISKRHEEYFGAHQSKINIYLSNWQTNPIEAIVNRTHQPAKTPRIHIGK